MKNKFKINILIAQVATIVILTVMLMASCSSSKKIKGTYPIAHYPCNIVTD